VIDQMRSDEAGTARDEDGSCKVHDASVMGRRIELPALPRSRLR
jgi:hypothetical protein